MIIPSWVARELPGEEISVIEKQFALLYVSRDTVLKVWCATQRPEAICQSNWLKSIPNFADSHLIHADGSIALKMRRLPRSANLASQLIECTCPASEEHIDQIWRIRENLFLPDAEYRTLGEVLSSLRANIHRQLIHLAPLGAASWITDAASLAQNLVEAVAARGALDEIVTVESHGNAFATNIWNIDGRWIALDNSLDLADRLTPATLVLAPAIVDLLLLHDNPAVAIQTIRDLRDADICFEILQAVILVKLLVRYRYSGSEAFLLDMIGNDREFDLRIIERAPDIAAMLIRSLSKP